MDEADLVQRLVLWDPNLAMAAALHYPELPDSQAKAFRSSVLICPVLPQMNPNSKPYKEVGALVLDRRDASPTTV